MRHPTWGGAVLGLVLLVGAGRPGFGQGVPAPPGPGGGDLNTLTHEMADRVRHLGEDIASDLGRAPRVRT